MKVFRVEFHFTGDASIHQIAVIEDADLADVEAGQRYKHVREYRGCILTQVTDFKELTSLEMIEVRDRLTMMMLKSQQKISEESSRLSKIVALNLSISQVEQAT